MRARTLFFWGALASCVISAVVFTAGWLWYDHKATTPENLFHQGRLDIYEYEQGEVPDLQYWSDTLLLLLKIVPASLLATWFVVSWFVFGRDAFRLQTIKSHFSALK